MKRIGVCCVLALVVVAIQWKGRAQGSSEKPTVIDSKKLTLTNHQPTTVSIKNIEVSGDFRAANNCAAKLAPGGSCTIWLVPRQNGSGRALGHLVVKSDASNKLLDVPLAVNLPAPTFLYVTNYGAANVSGYSVSSSGGLTPLASSPVSTGTNPSWVTLTPSQKFAYVADRADGGHVSGYSVNLMTGLLKQLPGSPYRANKGSQGVAVHPSGSFAYVVNSQTNDVSAYTIASGGVLKKISGSPFPTGGKFSFAITADPLGRFVYVPNRSSNNISGFSVNSTTGALTAIPGSPFASGTGPHTVAIDPTGTFLFSANHGPGNIGVYTIDSTTGALTQVAGSPFPIGLKTGPIGVFVDPVADFIYVTLHKTNAIAAFSYNPTTGALTAVPGSPFASGGTNPFLVTVDAAGRFAFVTNFGSNNVDVFAIDPSGALSPVTGSPFAAGANPRGEAVVSE